MAIVLMFVVVCGPNAAAGKSRLSEQRDFSAEDTLVKKPIAIPEDVMAILIKDAMVKVALEDQELPKGNPPSSWFSASAIHLSKSDEIDIVVIGKGPLAGSNVTTFWVFSATAVGHELVLTAPAHDLVVKNSLWKHHRNIELMRATAVVFSSVLFRFNGKRYEPYRKNSKRL